MPNVNVEIGEGMTALHKNDNVSDEDYQLVRELFEKIGKVAEIEEKDFINVTYCHNDCDNVYADEYSVCISR